MTPAIRRAAVVAVLLLAAALPLLADAPPPRASTPAPSVDQAFLASLAAPADGILPANIPQPVWMTCLSDCVAQLLACRQACHGNTQCQANCNDTYNCGCLCRGNNC
jgi:hypothetical protein